MKTQTKAKSKTKRKPKATQKQPKSNPEESQNKPNPFGEINQYELNGKLLEISLILGCDVLELIEIKNQIIKKGKMDADDKANEMHEAVVLEITNKLLAGETFPVTEW